MFRLPPNQGGITPRFPAPQGFQPMPFEGGLGGFPGKPQMPSGLGQMPAMPQPGQQGFGQPQAMPPQIPPQVMAMLQQRFGGQRKPGLFAGDPFQQGIGAGQIVGRTHSKGSPQTAMY